MATDDTPVSSVWALGDYHRFAKETVWDLGPLLVRACGIGPGQRVLDVASGSGNVALRAAEAGAEVVASTTFGPIVAIRQGSPERSEEFDREFLRFARESNRGSERAKYEFEYLLVLARTRDV